VFDEGEDVVRLTAERGGGEEVAGPDGVAWLRRNAGQVVWSRSGAGSIPCRLRISQTVEGATVIPRPTSSLWMRR
jgi:hypothetical protein